MRDQNIGDNGVYIYITCWANYFSLIIKYWEKDWVEKMDTCLLYFNIVIFV